MSTSMDSMHRREAEPAKIESSDSKPESLADVTGPAIDRGSISTAEIEKMQKESENLRPAG